MHLRNSFFSGLLSLTVSFSAVSLQATEKPVAWPADAFLPLTEARITALPEAERPAWINYLEQSRKIAASVPAVTEPEFSPLKPLDAPLTGARHAKGLRVGAQLEWYATDEARTLANHVVEHQVATGGWTKGNDYSAPPPPPSPKAKRDVWSLGTFDNNATVMELRFLASVLQAAPKDVRAETWKKSFLRGLEYIFNAQYPNGGFPQIFPLGGGYHDAVTYNDNAMVRVLELLDDIAANEPAFAFVPAEQRSEAAARLARGIDCVLKSQIVEPSGRRTVWGQQHDMLTLKPCAARNFEPIAASSSESTSVVRLLMHQPNATQYMAALEDAIAWFGKVCLRDVVWDRLTFPSKLVASPGAAPLWARIYEIGTDKPIFGDRDRMVHYEVGEISPERQKGYSWYSGWPESTLKEFAKWKEK